ncbi:IS1595 family transposase [Ferrimonas pelagia]|uniref:IS1595 family transposase n=1 Tax=Ferrimonas pelagia TaxID=1177826 RepID=UPI0031E980FF
MERLEFGKLLLILPELNRFQLRALVKRVNGDLEKDDVNYVAEKRCDSLSACPHCDYKAFVRWGHSGEQQRFKCKQCHRTFNEFTATPFARLKHRGKRLARYAQCMMEGLSLRQSAERCDMNLATSFHWRHRFLRQPECHRASTLGGIVEADEAFFRESFKGKRNITHRQPRKHGRPGRDGANPLIPVLLLLDRYEREADFVLSTNSLDEITPCFSGRIKTDSVLCTDGSSLYPSIAEGEGLHHRPVPIGTPGRTKGGGAFHIQTLNNYISRLRSWLQRFRGVGTEYLSNYLGWWRIVTQRKLETSRAWLEEGMLT